MVRKTWHAILLRSCADKLHAWNFARVITRTVLGNADKNCCHVRFRTFPRSLLKLSIKKQLQVLVFVTIAPQSVDGHIFTETTVQEQILYPLHLKLSNEYHYLNFPLCSIKLVPNCAESKDGSDCEGSYTYECVALYIPALQLNIYPRVIPLTSSGTNYVNQNNHVLQLSVTVIN